jgi:glucose dehydrogenase
MDGQQADIPRSLLLNSETLLPFSPPPFGTLVAVNLRDRSLAWSVPLGVMADPVMVLDALTWDSVSLGGPTTTGGGLVFIDATSDGVIRAFDIRTGVLLWRINSRPEVKPQPCSTSTNAGSTSSSPPEDMARWAALWETHWSRVHYRPTPEDRGGSRRQ